VEKKIPYLLIEEDLHHLSSAVLEHHPQKQVPLLFYKGVAYHQSSVIAEFLDEKFDFHEKQIANGEKQRLMPSTPEKRARVRQWSAWCDQVFKPDLDLYKYHYQRMPSDEQLALVERLHRYLNKIEGPLRRHPYIVGDTFGMADFYLFPFVRQLTMVTTPVLPDLEKHEVLLTWLNGIMKRPSMDRVMGKQGEKPMDLSNPIASA
jgi:glutathione S-transferase